MMLKIIGFGISKFILGWINFKGHISLKDFVERSFSEI